MVHCINTLIFKAVIDTLQARLFKTVGRVASFFPFHI